MDYKITLPNKIPLSFIPGLSRICYLCKLTLNPFKMLELATPSLLFSAISLIMLAYTNRFLSYASVVRALKERHEKDPNPKDISQIINLKKRLYLTRSMQILGILSLLFCVGAMFCLYISWDLVATWIFGIALILLGVSLGICIWEINISVKALEIHLEDLSEDRYKKKKSPK